MLFLLLTAAATPAAAPAQSPLRLDSRILAERRQPAADGSTRITLVAPNHVGPGDPVVVLLDWRNAGAQPISGLVVANPVPANLRYRAPAAGSPEPDLSVDGRTFGPLATLSIALPEGGRRPAAVADITHVRWRLPQTIAAGAAGRLAFQAVVR